MDEDAPPSVPVPPPPSAVSLGSLLNGTSPLRKSNGSNGGADYVNTCRMEDHPWFVGDMDREGANVALMRYPPGTYLVRRRVDPANQARAVFEFWRAFVIAGALRIDPGGQGELHP